MASLTFPASPTVDQQHTAENGVTYEWTGLAWRVVASGSIGGGGGDPAQPNVWSAVQTFLDGVAFGNGQMFVDDGVGVVALRSVDGPSIASFPKLHVYTYRRDASNWARIVIDFSYGQFLVNIETAGDGVADRVAMLWFNNLYLRTPVAFIGDNEVDIGQPTAGRPRTVYAGTSMHAPTQPPGTNSDALATTAFVQAAIAAALAVR